MKKIIVINLLSLLTMLFSPLVVSASNINDNSNLDSFQFDNIEYSLKNNGNTVLITDKDTSSSLTLEVIENNKVRAVDSQGNINIYTYDYFGNVYLDGKVVKKSVVSEDPTLTSDNFGLFNTVYNTWIFDYEYTGNTAVTGPAETIAMTIIGFIPIIGTLAAIMDVVQSFKNQNHTHLYFIAQVFRNADWSLYRVVTYFYSESGYKNLVRTTTNLHQIPVGSTSIED